MQASPGRRANVAKGRGRIPDNTRQLRCALLLDGRESDGARVRAALEREGIAWLDPGGSSAVPADVALATAGGYSRARADGGACPDGVPVVILSTSDPGGALPEGAAARAAWPAPASELACALYRAAWGARPATDGVVPPLRLLVSQLATVVWTTDRDLRITLCEGAGLSNLGINPAAIVGQRIPDLDVSDADRPAMVRSHELALAGESGRHEVVFGGALFGCYVEPLRSGRSIVGTVGACHDITEQRRLESAHLTQETRFRQLAEASEQVFWITEFHPERSIYTSPAFERVWGFPPERLASEPSLWRTAVHPDDRATLGEAFDRWTRGEDNLDALYRVVRPDGSVRHVHDRGVAIRRRDADGAVLEAVGIAEDVTERTLAEAELKEREERLRQITENMRDVFWLVSWDDLRVMYVSPAWRQVWGRDEYAQDEFLRIWAENIHPDDRDRVLARFREEAPKGTYEETYRINRPDGTPRWLHSRAFPLLNRDGRIYRIAGVTEDITERVIAERRLAEQEEQLRHAQKMEAVGLLAGGVAHDFSNLLMAIQGYVELAHSTIDRSHPAAESLERVIEAINQASAIAGSLLTFTRKAPTDLKPVELRDTVELSARLLRRALPASIDLRADIPKAGTLLMEGDSVQLQQVLMNLAINARDAMPDGGCIRVRLRHDPGPEGPGHAVLTVEDSGVGMAPEIRNRIFEPYFTTKPRGHGTGLGLSIVRAIVIDHGGTLDVRSDPDRGTCFTIRLPLTGRPTTPIATPPQAPTHAGNAGSALLAEDNPHVRAVLTSMLQRLGFGVVAASTGTDAARLHDETPGADAHALLVLDIDLPGRSGLDVLEHVRARGSRVPAVIITGGEHHDETTLPEHAAFLRKPFMLTDLAQAIERVRARSDDDTDPAPVTPSPA